MQARQLAEKLAAEVLKLVPVIGTIEREKKDRGDKVYIDTSQNDHADTLAAPYCVRPYHEPLVSTPLDWSEINAKLDRWKFTMHTIEKRLKASGDLFKSVLDERIRVANSRLLSKMLNK
ncbi:hypothetical protein K1Y79_04025 [Chitinophaga sp. B61]|uniref:DNA ligase D polymerase domain-containing protein n=1 Tax=Chitinophaga rhizophila TaxID=2866212 RepID=A0ABS7G754_9BACT|nr:hypothetical protein [Chitinophaga rhizophila]MBW8683493.1 hypothetical protein [Chitinophaga rhizophila]